MWVIWRLVGMQKNECTSAFRTASASTRGGRSRVHPLEFRLEGGERAAVRAAPPAGSSSSFGRHRDRASRSAATGD